jgi:hypothetical protein
MLRRWVPLIAVAALLAGTGLAASITQLPLWYALKGPAESYDGPPLEQHDVAMPEGSGNAEAIERGGSIPGWLTTVLIALGALVALVIVVLALRAVAGSGSKFRRRSLKRRERPENAPATLDDEVVAAIEAGLLELDEDGTDPRRAVIACWVRLERAAAGAGTARQKGDTSTDLVLRLLTGHRLSESVLTGFADVYRRARYASREVDETMRDQARSALTRLHGELTQAVDA